MTQRPASELEGLAVLAGRGSEQAMQELTLKCWPFLLSYLASLSVIRWLGRDEDHPRNVATDVLERLRAPDCLPSFDPKQGDFRPFLATIARRKAIDYVRVLAGRAPRDRAPNEMDEPGPKALLNLFASSADLVTLGQRPQFTQQQRVAQLLDAAQGFDERQRTALRLWLLDLNDDEIGEQLSCSAADAKKVRRAAVARLRDQFGYEDLKESF